jgi:hypothetical protein
MSQPIESFAESDTGLLFVANGFGDVLVWDGLTNQMEKAGLDEPTAAVTVSGTGAGGIVGTFTAYLRFVDRHGFYSSLSPISNEYDAAGLTGSISGATNATPVVITTSANHNLSTGARVKIEGIGGNTGANSIWDITVLTATTFSLDDSVGTAAYTGGGTWTSGISTINYTGVQAATDSRIVGRQILRNTDGQTDVYYVDVDTTDLNDPTLSSTRTDTELSAQEAQSILDDDGAALADANTPPPNHKPFLAFHLGHMFYAGHRDYQRGMVQVTNGSTTVTGVGTDWVSALEDRYLYVKDAPEPYQIDSVDTANQTLTLTSVYLGATNLFGLYGIRAAPAERRTVYYSISGLPAAVPATNGVTIPETGDDITGLMVRGSWLYVLEKRHIWKITFADSIPNDLGLFPASDRGCINNRCFVQVEDRVYMLDEQGVHIFGGPDDLPLSQPIQEIFRPEGTSRWRVDWNSQDLFHAVHYRPQETIRWFVCMSGSLWPRHALCYSYRLGRWWVEEFTSDMSGSCAGRIRDIPHSFLGSEARTVHVMNTGYLDVVNAQNGKVYGTVTSATVMTLSDSLATFGSDLVNATVTITDGRGRGQNRRIVSVSSGTMTLDRVWGILPDTTSTYQIGGVNWKYKTSWFRYAPNEQNADRRVETVFEPLSRTALARLKFYHDFEDEADLQALSITSAAKSGVRTASGEADLRIDLTKRAGIVQHRYPGHKELSSDGRRFVQLELQGASNDEPVSIYQLSFEGVGNPTAVDVP